MAISVLLPAPFWPTRPQNLARSDRQVHAGQRDGGPKPLGHAAHYESGGLRPRGPPDALSRGGPVAPLRSRGLAHARSALVVI